MTDICHVTIFDHHQMELPDPDTVNINKVCLVYLQLVFYELYLKQTHIRSVTAVAVAHTYKSMMASVNNSYVC
jgi:hypothetical protein